MARDERFVTIRQAMQALQLTRKGLQRWVEIGRLSLVLRKGKLVFRADEISACAEKKAFGGYELTADRQIVERDPSMG